MSGQVKRWRKVYPPDVYKDLGELTDKEVFMLSEMKESRRNSYLATIYGTATLNYARQQYEKKIYYKKRELARYAKQKESQQARPQMATVSS